MTISRTIKVAALLVCALPFTLSAIGTASAGSSSQSGIYKVAAANTKKARVNKRRTTRRSQARINKRRATSRTKSRVSKRHATTRTTTRRVATPTQRRINKRKAANPTQGRINQRQEVQNRQQYFKCADFSLRVLNACTQQHANDPGKQASCRSHYQGNIGRCQATFNQ